VCGVKKRRDSSKTRPNIQRIFAEVFHIYTLKTRKWKFFEKHKKHFQRKIASRKERLMNKLIEKELEMCFKKLIKLI